MSLNLTPLSPGGENLGGPPSQNRGFGSSSGVMMEGGATWLEGA